MTTTTAQTRVAPAHDRFRVVKVAADAWQAECNTCSWHGSVRAHPLDCGDDALTHTKQIGGPGW